MRIRFIGGQESSMGSMTLLETENTSLLIDCGLYRRTDLDSRHINRRFMFDPAVIRAVVLTDARAERAGNLPTLIRAGFRGDIYGTPATHDLCALMLTDIAREQQRQAEWLRLTNQPGADPLYDTGDAEIAMQQFVTVPVGGMFRISDSIQGIFYDGDPIIGPTGVVLEVQERGRVKRFRFSEHTAHPPQSFTPQPDDHALVL